MKSITPSRRRSVYNHEISNDENYDSDSEDDVTFDIDSIVNDIQIYAMKRQKNKQAKFAFQQDKSLMIPTESYNKLDQKSKSIWRTLPDDLKRTLLNINQSYKSNVHKSYKCKSS